MLTEHDLLVCNKLPAIVVMFTVRVHMKRAQCRAGSIEVIYMNKGSKVTTRC